MSRRDAVRTNGRLDVSERAFADYEQRVTEQPTPEELSLDGGVHDPSSPLIGSRLKLRALADVTPRQVRWLVPGLVPLRALTLVAGVGGLGKSTWLIARAAELAREGVDVIFVSFEDTPEEILRPRFAAAGADLGRVHVVVLDGNGIDTVALPRDLDELRQLVRGVGARLVVFDPIVAAFETGFDAHKDQHVRAVLAQLSCMAEEEDLAVAMVGHLNKAPSTDPYIRVTNSVAFWNASRSVVLITEDGGEDDGLRLVAQRKTNWSRRQVVERHRIEEIVLPETLDSETGEPIVTSRMVFVEAAEDINGAELLAAATTTKTQGAEALLAAILADGEWHESDVVKTPLMAAGFSARTIQRAKDELGVEHASHGFPRKTVWRRSAVVPSQPPADGTTADSAQPRGKPTASNPVVPHERTDVGLPPAEQTILDLLRETFDAREVST